jgi:vesicle-fusing ATPase
VINGPEVLDKFVGESENKIRYIFEKARKDQEANGNNSKLHVIIID